MLHLFNKLKNLFIENDSTEFTKKKRNSFYKKVFNHIEKYGLESSELRIIVENEVKKYIHPMIMETASNGIKYYRANPKYKLWCNRTFKYINNHPKLHHIKGGVYTYRGNKVEVTNYLLVSKKCDNPAKINFKD